MIGTYRGTMSGPGASVAVYDQPSGRVGAVRTDAISQTEWAIEEQEPGRWVGRMLLPRPGHEPLTVTGASEGGVIAALCSPIYDGDLEPGPGAPASADPDRAARPGRTIR